MTLTEGLRWVWRVALAAAVCALTLVGLPAPGSTSLAEPVVVGYPRCVSDGPATTWMWWAGDARLGVTKEPTITIGGVTYRTERVDCTGAAACLRLQPELAGKLSTIVGTSGADRLVGTPGRDLVIGGPGNDVLRGNEGADLLCGGPGDDMLSGGRGDDRLRGGEGSDRLFGRAGADHLSGGAGMDVLYGNMGFDELVGGQGPDVCIGGSGTDALTGCRSAIQDTTFGGARVREYTVEVEAGIGVSRIDVLAEVDRILADDRSWIGDGATGFRRVAANADFTVLVASPDTVDRLCAPLGTGGYLSCRNRSNIILNVNRWVGATDWWDAGLSTYREYLVNHEVGHLLGHGHVGCPSDGAVAPVMMQQTKGLGSCVANGWPYVDAGAATASTSGETGESDDGRVAG